MKIYCISDNTDTRAGMRLAGIDGAIVYNADEFKEKLAHCMSDKNIGIVLITENLAKTYPEMVSDIKLNAHLPLLVEIPDRHGTGRSKDFITNYVREAIGIKL